MGQINKYIETLGFPNKSEPFDFGEFFSYFPKISNNNFKITYIFYKDEISLFNYHLSEWNKNELDFFIAVGKDKSYIIKAKEKANNDNILENNVVIRSFDYGINTAGYENIVPSDIPFTKEKIDNSVFFNFVLEKQEKIKNEIDTHLLNNLIALKGEMSDFDKNNENINGLILKSLFIKYLEDRNILPNTSLIRALQSGSPEKLKKTFKDISIINGDILKNEIPILPGQINELKLFFTEDYKEYKESGSRYIPGLFPYKFDKIPIQLISNIYEEFLGKTEKKTKGIFYTRTFVVDFMLSHTIYPKIQKYPNSTILDPACGSGAFLVQTFKKILNTQQEKKLSIDDKANILKKQIFGVDIDANALQITAFSLYLTLLDGINKNEIQEQIEKETPILPSLIGSNLLQKNTITDKIKFNVEIDENKEKKKYSFSRFDCIVANPPWLQLENKGEAKKSREEINSSDIYKNIHNYQTSQAFLLRINTLCHNDTDIAIIVNNSNFLNDGAKNFRTEILEKYRLKYFYELSKIATILFKGTNYPSAVLILDKQNIENHKIRYITPQLTNFSRKLRLISYSSKDIKEVKQTDLKDEDILWRIFVNGDWKDYQLIKKMIINNQNNYKIRCQRGFEAFPENKMEQIGEVVKLPIYNTDDKTNYFIIDELDEFIWNRKFRRLPLPKLFSKVYFEKHILVQLKSPEEKELISKYYILKKNNYLLKTFRDYRIKLKVEAILSKINNSLFTGKRIIIERAPSKRNKIKSICIDNHTISKDNTLVFKIEEQENYKLFLATLNSSFTGYFFTNLSAQFSKGTRDALRTTYIKDFPFPIFKAGNAKKIEEKIDKIEIEKKAGKPTNKIEHEIDELVFNLYGLLEFEKDIIREFYQINVERKNDNVKLADIKTYINKFREVYQLMVKDDLRLNASFIKSNNIGTIIKFDIVNEKSFTPEVKQGGFEQKKVLQLVKDYHIQQEMLNGYINEEKVKIYDDKSFYIIKSNQFKDWTKRQATEDANEETREMMKKMF